MPKILLTIDIDVEGDFPNRKELAMRTKVEKEIDSQNIGKFAGSGGGLGAMDLGYLVEDEAVAREAIQRAIKLHLPDANYTVDAEEFDGDESDLIDDEFQLSIPRLIVFVLQIVAVLAVFSFVVWKLVAWLF